MLAATLLLLVLNDLRLWSIDADPQSLTNLLCARTDFPTVTGPFGWHVTAHRLDCTLFAKRSTTYVYMHGASGGDAPADLIFRYVGAPPQISWIDPKHLVLHVDALTGIELLLTIFAGIHITLDTPETPALTSPHAIKALSHRERLGEGASRAAPYSPQAFSGSANPRCARVNSIASNG